MEDIHPSSLADRKGVGNFSYSLEQYNIMGLFSYFDERSLYKDLVHIFKNLEALKKEYNKFDRLVLSPKGGCLYQKIEQDLELFIKKANSMPKAAKLIHTTIHGRDIYLPTILSMVQSDLDEIKRNCL